MVERNVPRLKDDRHPASAELTHGSVRCACEEVDEGRTLYDIGACRLRMLSMKTLAHTYSCN
jgi:hypothetical protein